MSHLHTVQRPPTRVPRYESPASLDAALDLLAELGSRARPIAGGTDLLVELDRGARTGIEVLVDLTRIGGLGTTEVDDGRVRLGPLVTHGDVVASPELVAAALPLAQACLEVGSPQLRNRATVVGNLVTASPANDTISALLALGATVELSSTRGRRELALGDFFTGFRSTALADDELVTAVRFAALDDTRRGLFVKLGNRRAQAISVVHLAVVAELDDDRIGGLRVALGSVAPTVVLVDGLDALAGRRLDDEAIDEVVRRVDATAAPIADVRASAEYRAATVGVMARRALETLVAGAEASRWPTDPPRLSTPAAVTETAVSVRRGDPIAAVVNGRPVEASASCTTLLDWLRDELGLTGTKEGCAEGECGACTVHLDGSAVMSCLVPAGRAAGADIVTVEGLARDGALHPIQQAFVDRAAVQCGFCTPGFLMASAKLLDEHPRPSREQVTAGLAGNLCRCTGYYSIHQALADAAEVGS